MQSYIFWILREENIFKTYICSALYLPTYLSFLELFISLGELELWSSVISLQPEQLYYF